MLCAEKLRRNDPLIDFKAPEYITIPKWTAEELMKAPAEAVKLYLYGLTRHTAQDIDQIAAETELSPAKVLEGFEMLKNLGLLTQDSDARVYDYRTEQQQAEPQTEAVYDNTEFNSLLQELFSDRILSIKDYATFYECKDVYGLPESVVLMLAEDCIMLHKAKNRLPMSFVRRMGQEWAEEGIDTIALAQEKMNAERSEKDGAKEVLRLLGIRKNPSEEEEKLYHKWTKVWGFSQGGIRASMVATTKAQYPSMKYLDAILKELYGLGKVTYNDVAEHFLAAEQADDILKKLMSCIGLPRRTVSDEQRRMYSRWRTMAFGEQEILYAGSIASKKGYASFEHIDKILTGWRMKGLVRIEDIENMLKNEEGRRAAAEEFLSRAGIEKSVTKTDIEKYERLQRKYGFSEEIMLFAAECAYGYASPMRAAETILAGWQSAKVTTLEQAREEHKNHRANAKKGGSTRFEERHYTEEELDAHIKDPLADILKELEELEELEG